MTTKYTLDNGHYTLENLQARKLHAAIRRTNSVYDPNVDHRQYSVVVLDKNNKLVDILQNYLDYEQACDTVAPLIPNTDFEESNSHSVFTKEHSIHV